MIFYSVVILENPDLCVSYVLFMGPEVRGERELVSKHVDLD